MIFDSKGVLRYKYLLIILFATILPRLEAAETTVVFLGNSLTEGYGVDKSNSYPSLIREHFKKSGKNNIKIINAGISGSTSSSAYSRLKWFLRINPDVLVLVLGGNDGLRGLSTTQLKDNLGRTIKLARDKGIKVLLGGIRIPPNYGRKYTNEFRKVYPELSSQYGVALIPFILEGVAGHGDKMLPDGIHPNENGHKIMAEIVLKYLNELL